jgi:uncharacterized protein (TIGR02118 family)
MSKITKGRNRPASAPANAYAGVAKAEGQSKVDPIGSPGGRMVKLVYCITKKPDLTDAEFFHYWETIHGPMGARIPGLQKLVQSRRITIPGDAHKPDFDSMAELWFDSVEDLLRARQSPEWKASTDDEVNFIDHCRVAYFVSEEHVIFAKK